MILRSQEVEQFVDGETRAHFLKDMVLVHGPEPLSMVRKRLAPRHQPAGGDAHATPVLLTHGFGQNRYSWHLSRRSFANYLACEGFDVFNLELRGHGRSRQLGARPSGAMDEYIHEDLPAALTEALALSGHTRAFLVGHSLGGLVAYAAAPELRDRIRGVVSIGAPYVFGKGNRFLLEGARLLALATARLRREAAFPVRLLQDLFNRQPGFWNTRLVPMPIRAWGPGAFERPVLDEYLRLAFDTGTLGELVQMVAMGTRGRFESEDGALDYAAAWERLDVPLLVVGGTHDRLAPVASVRPAYDRSASTDKTLCTFPLGHGDLILGRDAPRHTWPAVATWLRQRVARAGNSRPEAVRG